MAFQKSLISGRFLILLSTLIALSSAFCSTTSSTRRTDTLQRASPLDVVQISDLQQLLDVLPTPIAENPAPFAAASAAALFLATRPPTRIVSDRQLSNILEDTYLGQNLRQDESLTCIYKASRDGWSATKFHDRVDNQGSGVVVLQTAGGRVLGGFNPNGWRSTDDYTTSTTAFLWSFQGSKVKKYKASPSGPAVFDYATSGPCFGTGDLLIGPPRGAIMGGFAGPQMEDDSLAAGSLKQADILPGQTYATDQAWPVRGYKVPLREVEVYALVN